LSTSAQMKRAIRRLINSSGGQKLKQPAQRAIGVLGFELVPLHRPRWDHLAASLDRCRVVTALDIGANRGQYGTSLRLMGFRGPILSIEPMADAFSGLSAAAMGDPSWLVEHCAAGERTGRSTLNISGNSTSSSVLKITDAHLAAESSAGIVRTELIEVQTLDDLVSQHRLEPPYFLKIDVQGSELAVLAGALRTLENVNLVQVELSLRELYAGGSDYLTVLGKLKTAGFVPIAWDPAFADPHTGNVLQVDVLASREDQS
jgi:FkbM family methyltransferase